LGSEVFVIEVRRVVCASDIFGPFKSGGVSWVKSCSEVLGSLIGDVLSPKLPGFVAGLLDPHIGSNVGVGDAIGFVDAVDKDILGRCVSNGR